MHKTGDHDSVKSPKCIVPVAFRAAIDAIFSPGRVHPNPKNDRRSGAAQENMPDDVLPYATPATPTHPSQISPCTWAPRAPSRLRGLQTEATTDEANYAVALLE